MICAFCDKKLRSDNKIGACRKHRNTSDSRKSYIKNYATQNAEDIKKYKRKWSFKNRERLNKKLRQRYNKDVEHKLRVALRNRINRLLRRNTKASSVIKELGCTVYELKLYLESKFSPGMSWDNWGINGWHIDHIKPLSSFNLSDPKEFKTANHFTNLQPLWAEENILKRNRI